MSTGLVPEELDDYLRDAYGEPELLPYLLTEFVANIVADLSNEYQDRLGIDKSEIIQRVMNRLAVAPVRGHMTIAHRTYRIDTEGHRRVVQRDILAGALARTRPARALASYLRTAVRQTATTLARRAERARRRRLTPDVEPVDRGENSQSEDLEWVTHVVKQLPGDQRNAIVAYHFLQDGAPQAQVAGGLGISVSQLQKRLYKAYSRIRERHEALARPTNSGY